jgi:renalase
VIGYYFVPGLENSVMEEMVHDAIIVGAGVAGLQCARRLRSAGAEVLLLDRASKVGGRCATRCFAEQPADYGPLFLHGSDPGFLAALEAVPGAERLDGWPRHISGGGQPCQPSSFAPGERRLAFREGVNAFPQALAQGLEVRLNTQVSTLDAGPGGFVVHGSQGERFRTRELVLAMALEQSLSLLRTLPSGGERDGAIGLLEMFASLPCLAVIAGYGTSRSAPDWDVLYPEGRGEFLLIGNESSKRSAQAGPLCLVYQAPPQWSREHLEQPKELWSRELLSHAGAILGAWAAEPEWVHPHRWRYGRLDGANQLAGPLQLTGEWGRLGLAGDLFAPGGGVQASWCSGDRLAGRILAEPAP